MTVVTMTRREFSRLEVVVAIEEGQMPVSRAAELLGLSRRQIFRLLDRFRSIGPTWPLLRSCDDFLPCLYCNLKPRSAMSVYPSRAAVQQTSRQVSKAPNPEVVASFI
jgi:hypothetical protein